MKNDFLKVYFPLNILNISIYHEKNLTRNPLLASNMPSEACLNKAWSSEQDFHVR